MSDFILLIRPHQWFKNFFIFLPLFFSGELFITGKLTSSIITFIAFSFTASAIYCFNDLLDAPLDRIHPKKKERPIASGRVSKYQAILISLIFLALAVITCACWGGAIELVYLLSIYLLLNLLYTLKLKQIPILDVFIIAFGFVLRLIAGAISATVSVSPWIVVMTFLLALFLAFAKRRDDVVFFKQTGIQARKNIDRYNLQFMNQVIAVIAAVTMVAYIMFTVSPDVIERYHTDKLYITSLFVLAGLIRYLQISIVDAKSGSPTKVLMHDRFIQICIAMWLFSFMVILYA